MENEKKGVDRFDWSLAFILFLFLVVSLVAISSAQTHGQYDGNFVLQQVVWYGVGAFIIAFAMLFEPDQYKKLAWLLYGFGMFLLVFLHFAYLFSLFFVGVIMADRPQKNAAYTKRRENAFALFPTLALSRSGLGSESRLTPSQPENIKLPIKLYEYIIP